MVQLRKCKEVFEQNEISDQYFLNLHFYVEGFLKRLLFIGLRLSDVQYKAAQDAITKYHEPLPLMIQKAFILSGFDYKNGLCKFKDYKKIEEYFIGFSSKYRNYRVHGILDTLKDEELIEMLITIDKLYISIIVEFIKSNNKPSVFDKPKDWGAKVAKKKSMEDIFDNILKVKMKKQKYNKEDVKKWLNNKS